MQGYEFQREISAEIDARCKAMLLSPSYQVKRFLIRAVRIACGLAFGVAGAVILAATDSISDIPFASLTLGKMLKSAASVVFGCLFIYWAFWIAFSEGATKEENIASVKSDAEAAARARFPEDE